MIWLFDIHNYSKSFKYPFFEFASRYSNVTETSIIEGYKLLESGFYDLPINNTYFNVFYYICRWCSHCRILTKFISNK